MDGKSRTVSAQVAGGELEVSVPFTRSEWLWKLGRPDGPGLMSLVDPLVINTRIDARDNGTLFCDRVEATALIGTDREWVTDYGSVDESEESADGPHYSLPSGISEDLKSARGTALKAGYIATITNFGNATFDLLPPWPTRPLTTDDLAVVTESLMPEAIGRAFAHYATLQTGLPLRLSNPEVIAAQHRAGSKRARKDGEYWRLLAETVRQRNHGTTPAHAIQSMGSQSEGYSRARAYQILHELVGLGYLEPHEIRGKK